MKNLLDQEKLLSSGVVANNRMNRARNCRGGNSYFKDLSFDPIEFIQRKLSQHQPVSWLDLCCGEGRALIEAAQFFSDLQVRAKYQAKLHIIGIDLAGMFASAPTDLRNLTLLETSVETFEPGQKFDLITCVHGLHYLGDKLMAIQKAAGLLKNDGFFLANLDLKSLKLESAESSAQIFSKFLKDEGLTINSRKRLISLSGNRKFISPLIYLGADDTAGPNYTGQPAVDSYYKLKT